MTQEEVDLIYEYLHENYEYREGELFRKKKLGKWVKGTSLGTLLHREGARFEKRTRLTINGKIYDCSIARFMYIYHHKVDAIYIEFNDGNPMNTSIENLKDVRRRCVKLDRKLMGFTVTNTKNGERYRVMIYIKGKNVSLGSYETKEMAHKIYQYALKISTTSDISIEEIKFKISHEFPDYKLYIKNKTGYKGVCKHKDNKFIAQITNNRRIKHLGVFNTPQEAHAAYLKAKEEYAATKTLPAPSSN